MRSIRPEQWDDLIPPRILLVILFGHRFVVWFILLFALIFYGEIDRWRFVDVLEQWPREGEPVFMSHFATWDSAHYLYLSEVGYTEGEPACAFYPLWPHWVRWTSNLFGGTHVVWGTVWANTFSLAGAILFFHLVREKLTVASAQWATGLLVLFPGSLFFLFHYSEGLFFFLLMVHCRGWQRRSTWCIAVPAFLLPLVRPVGIFAVVPLIWGVFIEKRMSQSKWIVLIPFFGWAAYFLWIKQMTGNYTEGFFAQRFWPTNSALNLFSPLDFLESLMNPLTWHGYYGSMFDRIWWTLVVGTLPLIWLLDRQWFWWAVMLGVLPAVLSSFTSFTRYVVLAFPVFALWGHLLASCRFATFRWLVISLFAMMQWWLIWRHVNFRWAG